MGEHPLHGQFHREFGSLRHQLAVGGLLQAADIPGVGAVELLVELFAGEDGLVRVDDDDEFAAVNVGGEFRAMLAAENLGGGDGGLAEGLSGRVEDIPAALNGFRFCHVCGHTDHSSDEMVLESNGDDYNTTRMACQPSGRKKSEYSDLA